MMNVAEINAQVEIIRGMAYDDEAAHSREDDLHQSVLAAIAAGMADDPAACAAAALKTQEISFCRWCA